MLYKLPFRSEGIIWDMYTAQQAEQAEQDMALNPRQWNESLHL